MPVTPLRSQAPSGQGRDRGDWGKRLLLRGILVGGIIGVIVLGQKFIFIPKQLQTNKLKVTASFYPLAFLAQTIGGQRVSVTNLTPPGAEPHDFEPSTRDIAELEKQDIILLHGGGLEGYKDKISENINQDRTNIIIVGQPFMSNKQDPHMWLDPILYKKEAEVITAAFIRKDPSNKREYIANSRKFIRELDALHVAFKTGLQNCKQNTIITSHNAFSYLVQRYNLRQITLSGFSPEQEPSSKTLAEIATLAQINKIDYIFFEELVSPALANTIAQEIGAQTLVLSPLEGLTKKDNIAGKTYITIQRENMMNLRIALKCT